MSRQTIILIAVLVAIVAAILFLQSRKEHIDVSAIQRDAEIIVPGLTATEKAKTYDRARELVNPAGFINSEAFTLAEHIGKKVILLDIWTYSCINCQRTLPYITEWDRKYRDDGLLVVGLHSPEFEFEKDRGNVEDAVRRFNIEYPVVQDNDFGTWHAYGNRYWPRKYLIDIDGFVVYDHIGEGAYEETEVKIKELLAERAQKLAEEVSLDSTVSEIVVPDAVTERGPRSPETYFGAWRNSNFGNGDPGMLGGFRLTQPETIAPNIFYLDGAWNIHREYAENAEGDARIIYRYQGDKVFMVARAENGASLTLLHNGEPIGDAGGADVDEKGNVYVNDERLYKLVDNPDGPGEHTLEIIVNDPGFHIFTFTFG